MHPIDMSALDVPIQEVKEIMDNLDKTRDLSKTEYSTQASLGIYLQKLLVICSILQLECN